MVLRLISDRQGLPYSWPVDPNASFLPGMVAGLTVYGNAVVATVSNGMAPIGLIDDMKTKAFSAVAWDEIVIVEVDSFTANGAGDLITTREYKAELKNGNVFSESFVSNPVLVQLIPRNGVIVFPVGTVLNFDATGSGTPNAIKTTVRYSYQIPNVLGEDSTAGSQRMTVWFQRGVYQSDQIDITASYPLNANLFCNERGLLTTRQPFNEAPSIGIVTAPPTAFSANLEFLWL